MADGFAHEKGKNDDWRTPPWLLQALGVTFDVDVCASEHEDIVPARRYIRRAEDGLATPWEGFAFCNPPYSQVARWIAKMAAHGDGIALVFNRTSERWFQEHVFPQADALLFIAKRVAFVPPPGVVVKGSAGAGSVLVAYGPRAAGVLRTSSVLGCFVPLHRALATGVRQGDEWESL